MSKPVKQEPERRKSGRPKSVEPSSSVCAWLRASDHDRLVKLAMTRRTSVSSLVREIIVLTIR